MSRRRATEGRSCREGHMLSPDAAEFVPRGGSPIYGDAPDDDMQPVKIGGKDMIVGGYGEYAIKRDITKNKYNPGAIFEKYSGSTYITESIIISRILKEKPKNTDAFQTALTKLSNTIDDVNNVCVSTKDCGLSEPSPYADSFWKQIKRCPCKVISFITLSKKDVDEMVNEIDLQVLYKFVRAIISYTSVYEDKDLPSILSPPDIKLSSTILEIDSDDATVKDQFIKMHNSAIANINLIERYRDQIASALDKSADLLNDTFKTKS